MLRLKDPPQYLAANLEDFLVEGAVEAIKGQLNDAQESMQQEIQQILQACRPPAKGKARAADANAATAIPTAAAKAAAAKEVKRLRVARSQKMVLLLVDYVESHKLLKEGVFLMNMGAMGPRVAPHPHICVCLQSLLFAFGICN